MSQNNRGQRKKGNKQIRDRFLIVCEGESTEVNYFKSFPVKLDVEVVIEGKGFNTDSLVNRAIILKKEVEAKKQAYNQVWCVFDRDSFKIENFNHAFTLADKNEIRVAYSNEAFELWYLLHYHYYNTAIDRKQYCDKLTKLLKDQIYVKNDPDMYKVLKNRQATAINNAKKLYAGFITLKNKIILINLLI